jgi:hypothetical protein
MSDLGFFLFDCIIDEYFIDVMVKVYLHDLIWIQYLYFCRVMATLTIFQNGPMEK